jgi:glutamate racemase
LVGQIEKGNLAGVKTRAILQDALSPMLEGGIDTIVLGCTHYPFVIPLIKEIAGDSIRVIDPALPVARQAKRILEKNGTKNKPGKQAAVCYFTSGPVAEFSSVLPGLNYEPGPIQSVEWFSGKRIRRNQAE